MCFLYLLANTRYLHGHSCCVDPGANKVPSISNLFFILFSAGLEQHDHAKSEQLIIGVCFPYELRNCQSMKKKHEKITRVSCVLGMTFELD